jgi:cation diffusion facilitator family transporter
MNIAFNKKPMRIMAATVVIGVLIMAVKFAAYLLTTSNAILTDALESIINVVAGSFALYSLYIASKPKDTDHPYGHGKVEFLSAGFEGGLIVLAGIVIIAKAGYNFFYPPLIDHLGIGIILTAVTGVLNLMMGIYLTRQGNSINSPTLRADGNHLKADAYSSAGLLIGLTIIYITKITLLDNVVAILFGLIIILTGVRTFRESLAGIMDEADYKVIDRIIKILLDNRRPNWIDIHNLRVIKYGSAYHIDCHLTLPWYLNLMEVHVEMETIASLINEHMGGEVELFVHPDPFMPVSCKLGVTDSSGIKLEVYASIVSWTRENVMANKKHGF